MLISVVNLLALEFQDQHHNHHREMYLFGGLGYTSIHTSYLLAKDSETLTMAVSLAASTVTASVTAIAIFLICSWPLRVSVNDEREHRVAWMLPPTSGITNIT